MTLIRMLPLNSGSTRFNSVQPFTIPNHTSFILQSQFDKPGFHAGTPPPYNLTGSSVTAGAGHQTPGGQMGTAPSGHYTTPSHPYMPMMTQHHLTQAAMLHNLQPDISSGSSQRSGQSSQQKGSGASSAKQYANNYWGAS